MITQSRSNRIWFFLGGGETLWNMRFTLFSGHLIGSVNIHGVLIASSDSILPHVSTTENSARMKPGSDQMNKV